MLNDQILRAENHLAELNNELASNELRSQAQIILLQQLINPYIDVELLKTDQIRLAATELDEIVKAISALRVKIKAAKSELGK